MGLQGVGYDRSHLKKEKGWVIGTETVWLTRSKIFTSCYFKERFCQPSIFPSTSISCGDWLQSSSVTQSCPTLCDPMDCDTPGFPVHHQLPELLKLMSIELVMPSKHLILCCPLLLLPSIFSSIRVFSNESALHIGWAKFWSFSFNISPSNEHPGLISFRMDWLDLLAVQGTLKSFLQHHSLKASVIWC